MPFLRRFAFLLILALSSARADESAPSQADGQRALGTREAVILGLVEGVTEFLPISSTGHLILTNRALGLDDERILLDAQGRPLWLKPPVAGVSGGVPLTVKAAADTYIVVIQGGAILAVLLLFRARVGSVLRGVAGRDPDGLRLARNLALAFLPVVGVGLALDDWIDAHLFSVATVIAALVVGAVLMLAAERWRRSRPSAWFGRDLSDLSPLQAVSIGCMQCLALWPGMSRSMVTMVGGYFCGLSPSRAAEFSFLVGLPVLGGATAYKAWKAGPALLQAFGPGDMLVGAGVAAVSAAAAVRFLVAFLSRRGLEAFAVYRLVLAAALTIWLAL